MPKSDFKKVALQLCCMLLEHLFYRSTSGGLSYVLMISKRPLLQFPRSLKFKLNSFPYLQDYPSTLLFETQAVFSSQILNFVVG